MNCASALCSPRISEFAVKSGRKWCPVCLSPEMWLWPSLHRRGLKRNRRCRARPPAPGHSAWMEQSDRPPAWKERRVTASCIAASTMLVARNGNTISSCQSTLICHEWNLVTKKYIVYWSDYYYLSLINAACSSVSLCISLDNRKTSDYKTDTHTRSILIQNARHVHAIFR